MKLLQQSFTLKSPLLKLIARKKKTFVQSMVFKAFRLWKFFRNDGTTSEYQAGRTAADIIKTVRRQNAPAYIVLDSDDALEKAKEGADVLIVGYFKDAEGDATFKSVANKFRNDLSFAIVDSKGSSPHVVAYHKFDEKEVKHDGDYNADALEEFIRRESFPLLTEIGPENYAKFVERGYPLLWAFLQTDDQNVGSIESTLREVAKDFRKVSFVKLDGVKWANHAKNFGLSDKLPGIAVEDRANKKKFVYPESNIVAGDLKKFLKSFTDGTLEPTLKSQDPPTPNDGPVKVVVGKTFDEIVLDKTKDVLVEFYAPWCGHCKSLAPKYEELGKEFQATPSVVIAKVDATENDTPADIQGFPTLIFYPANDKSHPLTFNGERSQKAMSDYIKEHASTLKKGGAKLHDDL